MNSIRQPQPEKRKNIYKYSGLGFQLVVISLGLVLGGRQLDRFLDTGSLFIIIGLALSVFLVMYLLIRQLK